jgi:YVTN family beta-propeller protein
VFDVFTRRELARIPAGYGPYGLATACGGRLLLATNSFEDTVSIIDTQENRVTGSVVVGTTPVFLAVI